MPAAWPRLCHYSHAALRGGILYDALQLRCAEKARCDRIYTFNLSDFVRLAPQLGNRILAASNFPFCGLHSCFLQVSRMSKFLRREYLSTSLGGERIGD